MNEPEQIGDYRILQRIGRGGTGRTYLGVRAQSRSGATILVCVKTPHPRLAKDPRYLALFDHEARVASTLDHPNIVTLLGRGVDASSGLHYLAYPFIEGLDLAELIAAATARRTQLSWSVVGTIALECAIALESAHQDHRGSGRRNERAPIIHRDVCPANILISLAGASYLADFGFARAAEVGALQPSLSGGGRYPYSAPERFLDGRGYGPRADLFSLGVSLFEALTGRPYVANSVEAHVRRVLGGQRARIETHRAEYLRGATPRPELVDLVSVVHRLIEPNPRARYPTAAALVDALHAIPRPSDAHRELAHVARDHMPEWRRAARSAGDDSLVKRSASWCGERREPRASPSTGRGSLQAALAKVAPTEPAPSSGRLAHPTAGTAAAVEPAEAERSRDRLRTERDGARRRQPAVRASSPPAGPAARRRWVRRAAVVGAIGLFVGSVFLLSTIDTIWVPLLTDSSGWATVIDGYWTPQLTRIGWCGVALSSIAGLWLALLRVREQP